MSTQSTEADAGSVPVTTNEPAPFPRPPLPAPLRIALAIVAGVFGAASYLLFSGYLAIQAHGIPLGIVIDLNNSVVWLGDPQAPWLQLIALGAAAAAVVLLFSPRLKDSRTHGTNAHSYAFLATTITTVISAMVLTERPYRGGVMGVNGMIPEFLPPVPAEILVPFTWIQTSALEATTFALVAVLFALHVRSLIRRRTTSR